MNKKCVKCKTEYPLELFSIRKSSIDGYTNWCKKCKSDYNKLYRQKHYLKLLEYGKEYWKSYYEENKKMVLEKNHNDYLQHKDKWKPTRKKYNMLNKDKLYEAAKRRLSNPEKRLQRNLKNAARDKHLRQTDINYKLKKNLRCRVWSALKGAYKPKHTMELVGCDINELKLHLESQFKEGMSWENYGKWHVDHIKPCTSFDLSIPEEQSKCFHYTNLQPLWAIDNLLKTNKMV